MDSHYQDCLARHLHGAGALMTTAARSRDLHRLHGLHAEVVERRQGRFKRVDHFGVADCEWFGPKVGIGWTQAYRAGRIKKHAHLNPTDNAVLKDFLLSGGTVYHHIWHPPRIRPERVGWRVHQIGWMGQRMSGLILTVIPAWYLASGAVWVPPHIERVRKGEEDIREGRTYTTEQVERRLGLKPGGKG